MSKEKPRKQVDKFRDLARELECDESEERFDRVLVAVASPRVIDGGDPATIDDCKPRQNFGGGRSPHPTVPVRSR